MSAYYPSQGSYSHHGQPVVYTSSSHHHQPAYAGGSEYYAQPAGGVVYVPTHGSSGSHHRSRHHSHSHGHGIPQVVTSMGAPVVMQPSSHGGRHYSDGGHRHHLSFGERLRRFFGLAPRSGYRYKSNRGTWGFLGYSKKPRYVDATTGGEVDRRGRPIYRV
ncbi:hypothetical protein BDQ12DRAFT_675256 [Crucibulum laeve]|uniref:Uncharacterized protein n=1 Tax=Crucibulum laeve TaxID=68775 RepID=A0A5C3MDX8_9AGAR|nr:hypothetical protein BDQ12DRAFT_675256 [Crucibulum laeve]